MLPPAQKNNPPPIAAPVAPNRDDRASQATIVGPKPILNFPFFRRTPAPARAKKSMWPKKSHVDDPIFIGSGLEPLDFLDPSGESEDTFQRTITHPQVNYARNCWVYSALVYDRFYLAEHGIDVDTLSHQESDDAQRLLAARHMIEFNERRRCEATAGHWEEGWRGFIWESECDRERMVTQRVREEVAERLQCNAKAKDAEKKREEGGRKKKMKIWKW
ncbi:hypothetical protein H0H92_011338 [Tricholoma furcatifolium]|nr:hypothetical protein H0H92_011338 [Tricholoma furcatifolium]